MSMWHEVYSDYSLSFAQDLFEELCMRFCVVVSHLTASQA